MTTSDVTNLLALSSILAALVGLFWQVRSAKNLVALQLFADISSQYESENMQSCRAALAAKLLSEPNTLDIDDRVLVFYENIAILERKRVLDRDLLFNTFALDVWNYWAALRHYVEDCRKRFSDDSLYAETEQFIKRLRRQFKDSSPALIEQFLQLEARRGRGQMA